MESKLKLFELEQDLFDFYIDDIPIWERIRFKVYRRIKEQSGAGQAHTRIDQDMTDYLKGGYLFLKNIIFKNPFYAGDSGLLFIGHPRRKKENDGYWWDIYCDPIHEYCEFNYVHLENPHLLRHRQPARTENLRYLDIVKYGSKLQRMLGIARPKIPAAKQKKLRNVQQAIKAQFGANIDLVSLVRWELHIRNTRLWMYRRLLNQINPKVAVIVVSYGKETFIEACREQDIPVVELQHGVIHDGHFGYSFSGPRTKEMFPDYLLVWGDFWKETIEYPIPDDSVIPVGYPYFEQSAEQYRDVPSRDQILFISQGSIGEQLSKFALEVHDHSDIDHDIVYKLHPGEYDRWKEEYPWLIDADFEVIDESEPQLYQLFAESSAQVGVGSTAVYEGLAFDLETYVCDFPGAEVLQPLIAENTAERISSIEELAERLGTGTARFNRDRYFTPDATERICSVLGDFLRSGQDNEA